MSCSGSAFSDRGQRLLHGTMLNLLWALRRRASVHVLSWRLASASSASLQTRLGRLVGLLYERWLQNRTELAPWQPWRLRYSDTDLGARARDFVWSRMGVSEFRSHSRVHPQHTIPNTTVPACVIRDLSGSSPDLRRCSQGSGLGSAEHPLL